MGIVVESYMENLEGAEVGWSYGKQIGFEGVLSFSLFVVFSPQIKVSEMAMGVVLRQRGLGSLGGLRGPEGLNFPPPPSAIT